MPFDVSHILSWLERPAEADLPAWIQQSWEDPEGFIATLATASSNGRGTLPLKSRPGQHHDFFHDLVVRHASSDRVALRAYDRLKGWQVLSYRQLQEQAARRASEWARQGVKPGARVCLLHGMGPELLVSLMAALGLGACVSILPPQGTVLVSRRLAALQPEHISAEPHQLPLLQGFEQLLLQSRGGAPPAFTSHSYRPEEPVGLLFSPLADPPHVPLPLSAAEAWQGALRDGLLTFGLAPGEHLAAPGFPLLQVQPALLLATLLRGATYVHLELAELEREPSLLLAHPLRSLGVCPALRDLLLRTRPRLQGHVSHWFRNPEEPLVLHAWQEWIRQCGLSAVPNSNVLVDASAGGAVLTSARRKGEVLPEVLPVPGRRWALKDLSLSGQEAPADIGILTPLPDEGRPPSHVIVSKLRNGFLYAGPREPRREGRVFPSAEVVAALEGLPFVQGACIVPVPTSGTLGQYLFLLLVFTGYEPLEAAEREAPVRRQQLRRQLELRLGPEHLPERVEFFPLYPRRAKGVVDEAWCRSQYLTGMLHRKVREPMFQALTAVRARVLGQGAAGGEELTRSG
jgi:hypothetical protein